MKRDEELKKQLTMIKENNWEIPIGRDPYALSLEMLDNIGSIDSELRDSLILGLFLRVIIEKKISYEQMKELLKLSLSEEHLFYRVGKVDDDSVFNRTFTICIVDAIISVNNNQEEGFLNESEVLHVYEEVMRYFRNEKDLRGCVEGKGWAHSSAHTADVLCVLAENKFIKHKELMEILEVIKQKICVDTYTYINEEDERLVNVVMSIYHRNVITNEEIVNWIYSFQDIKKRGKYPEEEHLRENQKVFFRSLFFRFKKYNMDESLIKAVEKTLSNLPAFF